MIDVERGLTQLGQEIKQIGINIGENLQKKAHWHSQWNAGVC